MKKILSCIFISIFLFACSSVPITNRNQLLLVSEDEMINKSYTQYGQFIAENPPLRDKNAALVKKVGNNIARAVNQYFKKHPELNQNVLAYQWDFNLIKNNTPNAWCMPGGKVAVFTGILPYTQNESGLAVVMSHEIAHAIAQHGREQASYEVIKGLGGSIANIIGLNQNLYGGATNLMMLKHSRTQETEADQLGLVFMKLAGYNPNNAITFWQRMKTSSESQPVEFLSTHPNDDTRIKNIINYINSPEFKTIQ